MYTRTRTIVNVKSFKNVKKRKKKEKKRITKEESNHRCVRLAPVMHIYINIYILYRFIYDFIIFTREQRTTEPRLTSLCFSLIRAQNVSFYSTCVFINFFFSFFSSRRLL